MIDFLKASQYFTQYLKNYNLKDEQILLKVKHTREVVKISEYLAKQFNLNQEHVQLAKLIALLHDIGRFEQIKRYHQFLDHRSIDHASLGVQILFDHQYIRKFITETKYDTIIYKAILNHNRYQIEENLNEIEHFHACLIRDADKIDNFRVGIYDDLKNIVGASQAQLEKDFISSRVYQEFMNHQMIHFENIETNLDNWLANLAFIFDYNYNISLEYIQKKKYIDQFVKRLDFQSPKTQKQMEEIKNCVYEYIQTRLQGEEK